VISEATVIAVAVALYLADCIVLLERGQALIEARWSRVALAFGSRHYQAMGKVVAFLNPLTPFIPVFRSAPLFQASPSRLGAAANAAKLLVAPAALQLVLLFLVLPLCIYRAPGWPFFIALVLAYANAAVMLALLAWRFRKAGLPRRPLLALGFGWLACLPLSVNALRKAGLSFDVAIDARRALLLLPPGPRAIAQTALAAQIEEALQDLEENDARVPRLDLLRRALSTEAGHERI
jgi:hypothetical protein